MAMGIYALLLLLDMLYPRSGFPRAYLSHFADDAFFYFEIARHVVDQGISTFDTLTTTNGYHPLWLFCATIIGSVLGFDSPSFFVAIYALGLALCLAGYQFMRRLLRMTLIEPALSDFLALAYYFVALRFSTKGMETPLTFAFAPLMLCALHEYLRFPNTRRALLFGVWSSLTALGRLDSVLLVAIAVSCAAPLVAKRVSPHSVVRHVTAFGMGGALLPIYLLYNILTYGHPLPISGRAKGLGGSSTLYWPALRDLFRVRGPWDLLIPLGGTSVTLVAALTWNGWRKRMTAEAAAVASAIILFPVAFFPLTAWRSPWGFWPWYYYPIVFAFPLALGVREPVRSWATYHPTIPRSALCAAFIAIAGLKAGLRGPGENDMYVAGLQLQAFASENPGIYAMGDRAGLPGYLIDSPLLHLEGLASHTSMLDHIEQETDLIRVFREYGVDYYIATNPRRIEGCWSFVEPTQPGPTAPRMRARWCGAPAYTIESGRVTTRIFAIPHDGDAASSSNPHGIRLTAPIGLIEAPSL